MLAYRKPSQIPDHKRQSLLQQLEGWPREWASRRASDSIPVRDVPDERDFEALCGDAALDRTMPTLRVQVLAEKALLRGHQALAHGDMPAAVSHYHRARNILPEHPVPACWAAWAALGCRDYRGALRPTMIAEQNDKATSAEFACQALAYLGLGFVRSAAASLCKAERLALEEAGKAGLASATRHAFCTLDEDWEVWQTQCGEVRKEMEDLASQSHLTLEREMELLKEIKESERQEVLQEGCKQQ